jgi:hypothetical protein
MQYRISRFEICDIDFLALLLRYEKAYRNATT